MRTLFVVITIGRLAFSTQAVRRNLDRRHRAAAGAGAHLSGVWLMPEWQWPWHLRSSGFRRKPIMKGKEVQVERPKAKDTWRCSEIGRVKRGAIAPPPIAYLQQGRLWPGVQRLVLPRSAL